jgi:hypothetical protein
VDTAVTDRMLAALSPAELTLALAAADEVTDRRQRTSRAAELAVERARYEADRAERAFCQVEPENQLVARTLEARWETKLAALARPSKPWPRPKTRCRHYPPASSCRTWQPISPDSGGRPPPATRTANGCCAP